MDTKIFPTFHFCEYLHITYSKYTIVEISLPPCTPNISYLNNKLIVYFTNPFFLGFPIYIGSSAPEKVVKMEIIQIEY